MSLQKILASITVGTVLLTAAPIVTNDLIVTSTVEAAKGGAKISLPKSTPKVNIKKTPASSDAAKTPAASNPAKSTNESKAVSGAGKEYTPSKSAKELPNNAPKQSTAANKANTNTSSGFGNTLRNIGLFAGGMMLGGLIGSLLGDFGGGLIGDIFGLLFNLAIIYAIYRGGRYLWNRFRGNNNNQPQNKIEDFQPIDITPPQASNYPNQSTIGMDYDSKRAADHYRNL